MVPSFGSCFTMACKHHLHHHPWTKACAPCLATARKPAHMVSGQNGSTQATKWAANPGMTPYCGHWCTMSFHPLQAMGFACCMCECPCSCGVDPSNIGFSSEKGVETTDRLRVCVHSDPIFWELLHHGMQPPLTSPSTQECMCSFPSYLTEARTHGFWAQWLYPGHQVGCQPWDDPMLWALVHHVIPPTSSHGFYMLHV